MCLSLSFVINEASSLSIHGGRHCGVAWRGAARLSGAARRGHNLNLLPDCHPRRAIRGGPGPARAPGGG